MKTEYELLKCDFINKFPTRDDFTEWSKSNRSYHLLIIFQCFREEYIHYFDRIINELNY